MIRRIPATSYAIGCLLLSGCAGVVPLPTHTETPAQVQIKEKVTAKFVVPGQTTKGEVLAKLSSVDSGISDDQFFLARWSSSNKVGFALLCGYISCMGGGSRLWKTSNALLEFDDHNLVKRYSVFGDNALVTKLSPLAAQEQNMKFDDLREIQAEDIGHYNVIPATIILVRNTFELRESRKDDGRSYQIERNMVRRIRTRTSLA